LPTISARARLGDDAHRFRAGLGQLRLDLDLRALGVGRGLLRRVDRVLCTGIALDEGLRDRPHDELPDHRQGDQEDQQGPDEVPDVLGVERIESAAVRVLQQRREHRDDRHGSCGL